MKDRLKKASALVFGKEHITARAVRLTKLSRTADAAIAFGKIGLGVYSLSLFLCVNGLYNVGMAVAKHYALNVGGESEHPRSYGRVGSAVALTSILYIAYALHMAIRGRSGVQYDTITGIAIAAFTFTEIAVSVQGVIAARRNRNMILEAIKRTNLACSLIAIVLTQYALLSMSGVENAAAYCGWTGLLFGGASAFIGAQMMWRGWRKKTVSDGE